MPQKPQRNLLPGPIKKIVVLMLENRGFDHLMGWLYSRDEFQSINFNGPGDRLFRGLDAENLKALANSYPPPYAGAEAQIPLKGARSPKTPAYNPGESFQHIMNQMWNGAGVPPEVWKDPAFRTREMENIRERSGTVDPPMRGYVRDYYYSVQHHLHIDLPQEDLSEIMETYTPAQLPVLSGLARFYGVSDEWFCSVPSQTNTNRAFSMAGTSRGLVNNSFYDPLWDAAWKKPLQWWSNKQHEGSQSDALPVSTRCLFEVLEQFGFDWNVYWQSPWPPKFTEWERNPYPYTRKMFPFLRDAQFDQKFRFFDASKPDNEFYLLAEKGDLPALTWIEPYWGGGGKWSKAGFEDAYKFKLRGVGNDYHPVSDTTTGEDFVMDVYKAISRFSGWDDTLLVITFDENGGTYDHVPPPLASPSGNDRVPLPNPLPGTAGSMDAQTRTQFGFRFDQFGVRVPTLLISPRIEEKLVFRSPKPGVPFDHTSIIATVLKLAGIDPEDWQLGRRVANAPTFDHLILQNEYRRIDKFKALQALQVDPERPGSSPGVQLQYGLHYYLQYIGNPWPRNEKEREPAMFLGEGVRDGVSYYPTLVTQIGAAIRCKFAPAPGTPDNPELVNGALRNMALVRIVCAEEGPSKGQQLTVAGFWSKVFFSGNESKEESKWQIRILNSRNSEQPVQSSDEVYFVTQWKPAGGNFTDDPFHRLAKFPSANPADKQYLTTIPGEWAVWKVIVNDPNDVD